MSEKKILSLSLEVDVAEKLKLAAEQKTKGNVSKFIKEMVEKYINLNDNIIPIFLPIPLELKNNKKELSKWILTEVQRQLEE